MTILTFSASDVSRDLARQAHAGMSLTPEKRADQEVQGYVNYMAAVDEEFEGYATDENREQMAAELEAYRAEFVRRTEEHWRVMSRCMSTMIAGPSGFPVRKAERANRAEGRALNDLVEWRQRALERLRERYDQRRIASRPISADDDDAIERLQDKLNAAIELQERVKATNKACRNPKLDDDAKAALLSAMGYGERAIEAALHPDYGQPGIEPYVLANNAATIRRLKERIAELQAQRARAAEADYQVSILGEVAIVSENRTENRLQLRFSGVPLPAVRELLRRRGFKWAPSQDVWQRQLTDNAREAVRQMAGN